MFCSQCGKKVMDSMLFCPFCGSPIVIPEQEEEKQTEVSAEIAEEPKETPVPNAQPEFVPLDISINWDKEEIVPIAAQTPGDESEEPVAGDAGAADDVSGQVSELLGEQLREEPVRLGGHVPDLTNVRNPGSKGASGRRATSAYVAKAFNPNDIFLDGSDEEDYDDYEDEDYDYEEREAGGFLIRHIRGIVALSLFIVVLAIVAGWAFSDAGQLSLANANLAWRPAVYERLGYEAYQEGKYAYAGTCYERALDRDPDNYSYAYSAGVAYYTAQDIAKSAEMGRRAIEIDASRGDGYQLLMRLYPDAADRPWDVSALLQQGYRLTGDATLNVEG